MKKRVKNVAITEVILPAALVWFWGWFIFFLIETILKFMKGSSPWAFIVLPWSFILIAFVLLLYSGAGIALGSVFGGGVALLLRVATSWQRRIEPMALYYGLLYNSNPDVFTSPSLSIIHFSFTFPSYHLCSLIWLLSF